MSQNGQVAIVVTGFELPGGMTFGWHVHPVHQVLWAPSGVLRVATADGTWLLPPSRALWVPAGVRHTTGSAGVASMRGLYFAVDRCPIRWAEPTVIAVHGLLRELIEHLGTDLPDDARLRAEAVVYDLVTAVPSASVTVPQPRDPRALLVATRLRADPADQRGLADWGREAGASARTLARLFLAETGLSFGRWRSLARLEAAVAHLADGMAVGSVARRVGYATTSGFVAAFRRAVGVPPARYFGAVE